MSMQLGDRLTISQFVNIVRDGVKVEFSENYCERVKRARQLIERWVAEEKVIYGVTTGFGSLCTEVISADKTAQLQKNILLSHSVSVGKPLTIEQVRATMLMVLQNVGYGASGVRLEVLEYYKDFLNHNVTPWAPGDGSVGYLSVEAHMALNLLGLGKAYIPPAYNEDKHSHGVISNTCEDTVINHLDVNDDSLLVSGSEALHYIKREPIELAAKEGLALISGTTSVTALAALALYDMKQLVLTADCIGAMNLEVSEGNIEAFSEQAMVVRPHSEQMKTAINVRRLLHDSKIVGPGKGIRLQDPLSLRCIPQLHGAVKKTIADAWQTVETEMNSCCDNPIIWTEPSQEVAISACNCDSAYVGLEMDSVAAAAVLVGKMAERRTNRLLDPALSGKPAFLVKQPGLNSGLMITQYTQAGLLNEMRLSAYPATVDNVPTSANQEDYVAMGYTASKKLNGIIEKLEYILAFELLAVYQSCYYLNRIDEMSTATLKLFNFMKGRIPEFTDDVYLYPYIAWLQQQIHEGTILKLVNDVGIDLLWE